MYIPNEQRQSNSQKKNEGFSDRKNNREQRENRIDSRDVNDGLNDLGKSNVNSKCAFHPNQKITNFCTNRECLLPLCPKCVKIHTDEHIQMGIFGEFDTIDESLRIAQSGLRQSFEKVAQFQQLLIDVKQAYNSKISQQRRSIREAKNYYIQSIQQIFDIYEKALISFVEGQNKSFLQSMKNGEEILSEMLEHNQKCLKKLGGNSTLMEGIINYYSRAQQIQNISDLEEKLQDLFPENIELVYHASELDRLEATIKRYIDAGQYNDHIWNQYKGLTGQNNQNNQSIQKTPQKTMNKKIDKKIDSSNRQKTKIDQSVKKRQLPTIKSSNSKINEISNLQANLNLGKFKSPLDYFSLAKNRHKKDEDS